MKHPIVVKLKAKQKMKHPIVTNPKANKLKKTHDCSKKIKIK
jgi:hypothetical protein